MTATGPPARLRHLAAALFAALMALALVGAAPTAVQAQEDPVGDTLDEVTEGTEEDPTEDGGGGSEDGNALEICLDVLLDPENLEGDLDAAINECVEAIEDEAGGDGGGDELALEECQAALEEAAGDASEESVQNAVETCLALLEQEDPGETEEPDGATDPTGTVEPTGTGGGGQVSEVPQGGLATGGTATPTGGAHATVTAVLFAGLTGAGMLAARRQLGGLA